MSALLLLGIQIISQCAVITRCSEPNPPSWPPSVYIFKPGNDSYTQSIVDAVFKENGGTTPEYNGQFSDKRYALLFHPGIHKVDVNVGYYTTVMGLGQNPQDTTIQNVLSSNGGDIPAPGALDNFWRNAENFMTTPTLTQNYHENTMMWAVSQGVSLRRVIINGNLDLYEATGYASGGYLSNCYVTGTITSGTQQQWYTRNTDMNAWVGGVWNMVYQGVRNTPNSFCSNQTSLHTPLPTTPIIAEKPYISYENGKYYLMVPPIEHDKIGPTDFYASTTKNTNITQIDFENVYVTDSRKDTASSINSALAKGLHVVFTAGNYNLTAPIQVTRSNTVVLGIGFPTLMATNGNILMDVADGVEGVHIAGIFYEAGPKNSSTLLRIGTTQTNGVGYNFLSDVFARVGGRNDPRKKQVMAGIMVQINANNVIMDNSWLWRADHDVQGNVEGGDNPVNVALQVNGDNVHAYCLKVEHTLHDLVEWNGDDGGIYMLQSEFPYDVNQEQYGDPGYVAVRVGDNVKSFTGYGMGMYSYFRDYDVTVENAIYVPQNVDSIQFINVCTVWLDGRGKINHVINGLGGAVHVEYRDTPAVVCQWSSTPSELSTTSGVITTTKKSEKESEKGLDAIHGVVWLIIVIVLVLIIVILLILYAKTRKQLSDVTHRSGFVQMAK